MRTPSCSELLVLLALAVFLPGSDAAAQSTPAKPKAAGDLKNSQDFQADLLKERDRVEFNVKLARRKLDKNLDALDAVKLKYTAVWRNANLLVQDIQDSIRAGKDPAASKLFRRRAEEAQKAILEFNAHVETALLPPEDRPKFVAVLIPVIVPLADLLWKRMGERKAATDAERKAEREELARQLDELKFREFNQVT